MAKVVNQFISENCFAHYFRVNDLLNRYTRSTYFI